LVIQAPNGLGFVGEEGSVDDVGESAAEQAECFGGGVAGLDASVEVGASEPWITNHLT
jgi:hypothetical protein